MQKFKLLLTKMLLVLLLSCSVAPTAPVTVQHTVTVQAATRYNKPTIKKVQKALNRLGYDCGNPDGIAGSKTQKAIRQYRRDHHLKVTGTITPKLLKSLDVTPVKDSAARSSGTSTNKELTVYITDTGSKYHRDGCRYLSRSKHAISKSNAQAAGYTACSVCNP